jgi:hypothetical protein
VNCRPLRYSSKQKDEIERQVTKVLECGIVVPSLSSFTSPVLLVKKKDDSWRFCIDYRKLNIILVKNKFPLPIIDEFLDEVVGAKYFQLFILPLVAIKFKLLLKMRPTLPSKHIMGIFSL